MFNLGPLELVAIFVVALLVFGPDKLPEIGRQVGRGVREFRRIQRTFQTELRDVLEEPLSGEPAASRADPTPAETPTPADNGAAPPSPTPDAADETQSGSSAPGVNPPEGNAPEHKST